MTGQRQHVKQDQTETTWVQSGAKHDMFFNNEQQSPSKHKISKCYRNMHEHQTTMWEHYMWTKVHPVNITQ